VIRAQVYRLHGGPVTVATIVSQKDEHTLGIGTGHWSHCIGHAVAGTIEVLTEYDNWFISQV